MQTKEDYYDFVYTKLVAIFPEKPWTIALNRFKETKTLTIKNLTDYIVPYGIELWENKGDAEYDEYLNSAISDSMFYCGKILEILDSIEKNHHNKFKQRFKAAFRQPHDMRSLIFEVFVYFTIINYSYNIEHKDNEITGETYDYLIKKDKKRIQIECKSFAHDKGLHITGDESQKIIKSILNMGDDLKINESSTGEISILTVEIISSSPTDQRVLINSILKEIREKSYTSTDNFIFYLDRYSNVKNISATDAALDLPCLQQYGVDLGFIISSPNNDQSRYGLRITTHATNGFLREFEKVCKDAAKKQLKKNQPASIIVHIDNIEILKSLLNDPRFHHKLNSIFNQDHIISLITISNIQTNTQEEYPFFYISPFIKEFINERSKFHSEIEKIIQ